MPQIFVTLFPGLVGGCVSDGFDGGCEGVSEECDRVSDGVRQCE